MLDNGILLFSKNFTEIKYDTNLLVGFFASIANFSREALQNIVKTIDLGLDDKLILHPLMGGNLIGAAIISEADDNQLMRNILNNILLDFTHEFTSYDNPDNIETAIIEKIVKENLHRKVLPSIPILIIASILILTPLLSILIFLSTYLTHYLEDLFINIPIALLLYSTINLLLLTIAPNVISGFLAHDIRYALFNTVVIVIVEMAVYIVSVDIYFVQITLANLPINFILSLASAYFGLSLSSRKYLRN